MPKIAKNFGISTMAERFVKIVIENMVIKNKFIHFFACPFTGLGLHAGFRGNVWLKNRIHIFEQFVLPSLLLNQTNTDFILWVDLIIKRAKQIVQKYEYDFLTKHFL